tara:strand:- start:336 stop:1133 length:798 start_codon:yes stop_codon:yes gene_type:complete
MRTYRVVIKGVTYYVNATSPEDAESKARRSRFGATMLPDDTATVTESSIPEGVSDLNIINETTSPQLYGGLGPAPPTGTVNPAPLDPADESSFFAQFLPDFTQPFTQARQAIGRALPNINISGGLGRSLANTLANPTISNFLARTALDQPERARLSFTGNPFAQSATTFSDLVSAARQPGSIGDNEFLRNLVNPVATEGQGVSRNQFAQQAANLARSAARDRYGSLFANAFVPQTSAVLQQFEESPQFGTDAGFLPFLQQRFGLT